MEDQDTNNQSPGSAPQTAPTSPTILKNSGLKSKLPWIIIAFLLVLVGVFGGYFVFNQKKQNQTSSTTSAPTVPEQSQLKITPSATPTTTEDQTTKNWKLYTNSESGYSVKYPSDLYVRLICPGEELVLRIRTAKDTKDEETFETCGRGGRFEIEVVTADSFTEPTTDDYVSVTKEEILVAGQTARKYISTKKPGAEGPIPDFSEDIYFDKDGKKHLIHFGKSVSDDIKNKILASFKFL